MSEPDSQSVQPLPDDAAVTRSKFEPKMLAVLGLRLGRSCIRGAGSVMGPSAAGRSSQLLKGKPQARGERAWGLNPTTTNARSLRGRGERWDLTTQAIQ